MEIRTWNNRQEYLALSCIMHLIALLLLSLQQKNLPEVPQRSLNDTTNTHIISTKKKLFESSKDRTQKNQIDPLSAPLINPPCILYKPGGGKKSSVSQESSSSQPKKVKGSLEGKVTGDTLQDPGIKTGDTTQQVSSTTQEHTVSKTASEQSSAVQTTINQDTVLESTFSHGAVQRDHESPIATPTITPITASTFLHSQEPLTTEKQSKIPQKKQLPIQKKSTQKKAFSSVEQKAVSLAVDKIIEAPESSSVSPTASTTQGDGTRKRKLILSDLFKDLSQFQFYTSQTDQNSTGDGAPAVIVQGDIRYHSFVTSIVEHINSTSKHRNGDTIIRSLIQAGTIKQNLKLSITLEKSGKVLDARTLVSSGCPQLDSFWVTTAYEASPFAPLPAHFKRDMVRVELVTQL